MKQIPQALIVTIALALGAFSQPSRRVTARSVWEPGTALLQEIREHCGGTPTEPFAECFLSIMQKSGANPEALAFSRQIGNQGYLRNLIDLGPVSIGYVQFPFRANENQGAFIVNGSPAMIDIDQPSLLALDELQKNLTYTMIAERTPQVSVWPGDRNGTAYAVTKKLPMGGVRITIPYVLRNGCRACALLGTATFSFDFERSGRFLGTRLLGVSAQKTPFRQ